MFPFLISLTLHPFSLQFLVQCWLGKLDERGKTLKITLKRIRPGLSRLAAVANFNKGLLHICSLSPRLSRTGLTLRDLGCGLPDLAR